MSSDGIAGLVLEQCLFGYDDGHKLLSSSIGLTPEIEHYLLEASDLDPNATSASFGYWTGLPLPGMRAYALMKTWAAPEMKRPGCVWTHAIIISNSDMAKIENFELIASLVKRPGLCTQRHEYEEKLTVSLVDYKQQRHFLSVEDVVKATDALYSSEASGLLALEPDKAEDVIFAIWSQQWPRLRRVFRFRTAFVGVGSRDKLKFDLRLDAPNYDVEDLFSIESIPDWQQVVFVDLRGGSESNLRRFLWRYGSDINTGKKRFEFLVELYIQAVKNSFGMNSFSVLNKVADELPNPTDGALLKKDLLAVGMSSYSMLPALDPLHVISYFVNDIRSLAYSELPTIAFDMVEKFWVARTDEILVLADQAISFKHKIGVDLVGKISLLADANNFLRISRRVPKVRALVVKSNPGLLNSPDLSEIRGQELISLLENIPDESEFASDIITRLVGTNDAEAASFFKFKFKAVLQRVVRNLLASETQRKSIAPCWETAATISTGAEFLASIKEASGSAREVHACIQLSNFNFDMAKSLPLEIWRMVVEKSADDIYGRPRLVYKAFLLSIAFESREYGREPIFEYSFEAVHKAIWNAELPYQSLELISSYLPQVPFWQQWDTCLRLRLAIAATYEFGKLDRDSFFRLSDDQEIVDMLRALMRSKKKWWK